MAASVLLIFLNTLLLSVTVNSNPSYCGTRNQFRQYCFSFEHCTNFECQTEKCGYFPRNSVLLKIHEMKIIPQCVIMNSTTLKCISGINSNIHVLTSGSFAHLPNLESIILPFNQIRELHHGIFYDVNVDLLDLSWNKIVYVSEGAFNGVTGLKYLNLSKNELMTLPVEYLPISIMKINLSYNFLEWIALNGAKRPDLTSVDLSYNNLENVALSFDNTLKELDFTHNQLKDIDFYDVNDCENLKIPSNLFSNVPKFLKYSRIGRVAIHPNPWQCDELKQLWRHLQSNNIEEEQISDNFQPLCSIHSITMSSLLQNLDLECENDNHCAKNQLCRSHKCWNPCTIACEGTNICNVENHRISCMCPGTTKKDPHKVFSPCFDVECFRDSDCDPGNICNYNKTCMPIYIGESMPSMVQVGSGFSTTVRPASISIPVVPGSASLFEVAEDEPAHVPWWFEDIPKLTPAHKIPEN